MPMPNNNRTVESIPVSEFKIGDIYLRNERHEYKIVDIRVKSSKQNPGLNLLHLFCEWTGRGSAPRLRAWENKIFSDRMRQRVFYGRRCAPCYDSDCDCVYDQVGYHDDY
jgi:hypothetical protein